ncbi:Pectin lyase fold/virulence factor [Pseudocohnilembus persalinus]|uniref:Pectin lyase fold/virulence factor n=1 Tax=Pseudocohnilembus persalinus TaxID=266149 RepID=A0A0V0R513_PSEPJ|nr:Pectin lyase fold/virulence factor [Pseudocohnilembus persalinus]|eukprot:KRX09333.1 Pectin lyase fold/virulence factor [Pseudocohnilembus persalinus]
MENIYYGDIDEIIIKENEAGSKNGGLFIKNSKNLDINNISFYENSADLYGSGLGITDSSDILIEKINLTKNTANQNGALFLENVQNQVIIDLNANNNWNQMQGGAVYLINCGQISIQNSNFLENNSQNQGGGIYIGLSFDILIINSKFIKNTANQMGGGLYLEKIVNGQIKDSFFSQNEGKKGGGGAGMTASVFEGNLVGGGYGGGVGINGDGPVYVVGSAFRANEGANRGGGISCLQVSVIYFTDCGFFDHTYGGNIYGGAFYSYMSVSLVLDKVVFENNLSQAQGAGIHFYYGYLMYIYNSEFYKNKLIKDDDASDSYGGGYYANIINTLNMQNCTFKDNFAQLKGGGLAITDIYTSILYNVTIDNNHATYDKNIPLYQKGPKYMQSLGGGLYWDAEKNDNSIYHTLNMSKIIFTNNQASSGGAFMIQSRPNQQLEINLQDIKFYDNLGDIGPAIRYLGENRENINNLQEKNDIKFKGNVGIMYSDDVYTKFTDKEVLISDSSYVFSLCQTGFYLKEIYQTICQPCIENAVCEGGYIPIYPEKYFWRAEKEDLQFYFCENNQEACLGNDTCKQGHTGPLCESCDIQNNFGPYGKECQKCESDFLIGFKIAVYGLSLLFIIAYQIYGVRKKVNKKIFSQVFMNIWDYPVNSASNVSGIVKVAIMHCQVFYLMSDFTLNMPFEVVSVFEIFGNPQTSMSTNLTCILVQEDVEKSQYLINIYALAVVTVVLVLAILIELCLHYFVKFFQNKRQLMDYILCSIVSFILAIQPGILQNSFKFIICREIAEIEYSTADLNIQCKTDFFKKNVLPKMLCVGMSIIFSENLVFKGVFSALVILYYVGFCKYRDPYITLKLNRLQIFSGLVLVTTICFGICINYADSSEMEQIISIMIIFINGVFALQCLYLVLTEFRFFCYLQFYNYGGRFSNKIKLMAEKKLQSYKKTKQRWLVLRKYIRNCIAQNKTCNERKDFKELLYTSYVSGITKQFVDKSPGISNQLFSNGDSIKFIQQNDKR